MIHILLLIVILVFLAAAGYLLGSIPFGLLVTRAAGLGDIRAIGSGNIGATNVLRTGRKELAAATLALDWLKGFVAVYLGGLLAGEAGQLVGGLAAVLGHLYPVWLGFKGGKGVATGFGVLFGASPLTAIGAAAIWVGSAQILRISSASALLACVAAPILGALVGVGWPIEILILGTAVLVIARHGDNIRRLRAGTEPRIGR
jgi:acyl phosphate:glycerol-3-phosphate acyltransferase